MFTLNSLTLRVGSRLLIDRQSIMIPSGSNVGLVGANGSGKSTLLRFICGQVSSDYGDIMCPNNMRISIMEQETPSVNRRALDYVLDAHNEYRRIERKLRCCADSDIAKFHEEFENIDGWRLMSVAASLLSGLGFSESQQKNKVSELSGGWRVRLNLARALLVPTDLLLLDEPTNHLDLDAISWLEDFLDRFEGTVLVVAHDRTFLDHVTNFTLALQNRELNLYRGNYSHYEVQRSQAIEQDAAEREKALRKKDKLETFVRRFQAKASKAKQATSRARQLKKLVIQAPLRSQSKFDFTIPSSDKVSNPLIHVADISLGYSGVPILCSINLGLYPGDRLGLLGQNGAGKTTFIKGLVGDLPCLSGGIQRGSNTKIGYFAQEQLEALDQGETPLTTFQREISNTKEQVLRDFLGRWGFCRDRAESEIGKLSGGERARLALAFIAFKAPNLLILDEPTNHLDLEARQALVEALVDFSGAIIVVSHDRFLLEAVCDNFIRVIDGSIEPYLNDLDSYRQDSVRSKRFTNKRSLPQKKRENRSQNKSTNVLRKSLQLCEQKLSELSKLLANIDLTMADPGYYKNSSVQAQKEDTSIRKNLSSQIGELETEWLEITEKLENGQDNESCIISESK